MELIDEMRGKWHVFNTLTEIAHATYGDLKDVTEQLERQSAIWVQKVSDRNLPIRGSAWRGQISAETRKAASKKAGKKNADNG